MWGFVTHHGISLGHCDTIASPQSVIPVLVLTGLNGPMIREAMPFPSILFDVSSFLSPSFFTGGIPCDYKTEWKKSRLFWASKKTTKQKNLQRMKHVPLLCCLLQVEWQDKEINSIYLFQPNFILFFYHREITSIVWLYSAFICNLHNVIFI